MTKKSTANLALPSVVVRRGASKLELFAARELCRYLQELFGIKVRPATTLSPKSTAVFLVASLAGDSPAREACPDLPEDLDEQAIVLQKAIYQEKPVFVVGGGSAPAVLWAVYELAEHWGVCFLIDRDVLPEGGRRFRVPGLKISKVPQFRVRAHPTIQDLVASGECWGFEHFRVMIDQLAKLKFNRLCICTYGWQPFLHWQYKGIERRSATLWYDYRYHIASDTIGKELFGPNREFWNPDLPLTSDYQSLVKAGIALVRKLIDYGHERGMECVVSAPMTDFPPEFAPLLPGAERSHQLGGASVVPGQNTKMDDENLLGMASAVLNATLETYPDADRVTVWMPEFRQWTGEYQRAWDALDKKYRISEVLDLSAALEAAGARGAREGDPQRVINEVKADLTSLYFYDRMLRRSVETGGRDLRKKFLYWGPVEELFPILDRILPADWELEIMPTNLPATLLKRIKVLNSLPRSIAASMALTIDDDNIGVLPQLTTGALHQTVKVMKRRGWNGFTARERFPADHDVPLNYLARVAWEDAVTPDVVAADVVEKLCGKAAVPGMLAVFKVVEKTTEILSVSNFAFPADWPVATKSNPGGMLLKHMVPGETPASMKKAHAGYKRALGHLRSARPKARKSGQWYLEYWAGRIEFAILYLECALDVQRIANAQAEGDHVAFTKLADRALEKIEAALRAYVRVVRSQTDVGAIAVVNEHAYRPLKMRSWAYHAHGAHYLLPLLR